MWWVWDGPFATGAFEGAYTSRGAYGQFFAVLPKLDMVVSHKVFPVNRSVRDEDWNMMLHRLAGDVPASEYVLPVLEKQGQVAAVALFNELKSKPGIIGDDSDLYAVGVSADLAKHYSKAEKVLQLNLALFPKSGRTLYALGLVQAHDGRRAAAIETLNKIPANSSNARPSKVQLALMGEVVDGHEVVARTTPSKLALVTGRYKNVEELTNVKAAGGHLHVIARDPYGELSDEFDAFTDKAGGFYVPIDGSSITFETDKLGRATTLVRHLGQESTRSERAKA